MEETAPSPGAPASDPDRPRDTAEEAEGDSREASSSEKQQLPVDRAEILRAMEIVERDSAAIAQSYASLFSSLRLALAEVSGNSVEHMQCFNDIAGCLQESVLDAASKGNKFINSCLRDADMVIFAACIDNMLLAGDDNLGILNTRALLHDVFETKDLGELNYFSS